MTTSITKKHIRHEWSEWRVAWRYHRQFSISIPELADQCRVQMRIWARYRILFFPMGSSNRVNSLAGNWETAR